MVSACGIFLVAILVLAGCKRENPGTTQSAVDGDVKGEITSANGAANGPRDSAIAAPSADDSIIAPQPPSPYGPPAATRADVFAMHSQITRSVASADTTSSEHYPNVADQLRTQLSELANSLEGTEDFGEGQKALGKDYVEKKFGPALDLLSKAGDATLFKSGLGNIAELLQEYKTNVLGDPSAPKKEQ